MALTGSATDHIVQISAARAPQIGDVGTVVDVTERMGGLGRHYTVVLTGNGGRPVWMAVFAGHELELVG